MSTVNINLTFNEYLAMIEMLNFHMKKAYEIQCQSVVANWDNAQNSKDSQTKLKLNSQLQFPCIKHEEKWDCMYYDTYEREPNGKREIPPVLRREKLKIQRMKSKIYVLIAPLQQLPKQQRWQQQQI